MTEEYARDFEREINKLLRNDPEVTTEKVIEVMQDRDCFRHFFGIAFTWQPVVPEGQIKIPRDQIYEEVNAYLTAKKENIAAGFEDPKPIHYHIHGRGHNHSTKYPKGHHHDYDFGDVTPLKHDPKKKVTWIKTVAAQRALNKETGRKSLAPISLAKSAPDSVYD